jgi:uncharacterized repeat protein (TIGR03803 family)
MNKIRNYWMLALLLALILLFAGHIVYAQTYSVIYDFGSQGSTGPLEPMGGVIAQGRNGSLYSTSPGGGTTNNGTAFTVSPAGNLRVLYSFCSQPNCADGQLPTGGLVVSPDGSFYGTTNTGGTTGCYQSFGCGTVFRITPGGSLTTIYRFQGGNDGANPLASPVLGRDGNFYGMAYIGGQSNCGTIYRVTPSGGFDLLYQFDMTHGCSPASALVLGTDGSLYGTTEMGGTSNLGVVFRFTPPANLTVLYNFKSNGNDTFQPLGPLYEGNDGNFYGTASGQFGNGSIFRITPSGVLTFLHVLNGTTDGAQPISGVVQGTDGNFYGTASLGGVSGTCDPGGCGTLFKITPSDNYSVLYSPDGTTGQGPYTTLVENTNGLFYGDMYKGGDVQSCVSLHDLDICGLFYSLDASLPRFVNPVPSFGKVGTTIGILGQAFTSASKVSFNGIPAKVVTGSTATFLLATVPSGATTGFVTVTTPTGTLTSKQKFIILP